MKLMANETVKSQGTDLQSNFTADWSTSLSLSNTSLLAS